MHSLLEKLRPGVALTGRNLAGVEVGELKEGQTIIAGQYDHGFTHQLRVALDLNGQRYIEKVLFEVSRQAFGLGKQTSGCTDFCGCH